MKTMILVHIPEAIEPLDRGARYEDPLTASLQAAGIGEVTGGGSMLNLGPNGPEIGGVDVEIMVNDVDKAIPLIRACLNKAGAPSETTIEICGEDDGEIVPLNET